MRTSPTASQPSMPALRTSALKAAYPAWAEAELSQPRYRSIYLYSQRVMGEFYSERQVKHLPRRFRCLDALRPVLPVGLPTSYRVARRWWYWSRRRSRAPGRAPSGEKAQVRGRICARICARDGPQHVETGETPRVTDERPQVIGRGQRHYRRRAETAETPVVLLITQRSQVQILPPLPWSEAGSE